VQVEAGESKLLLLENFSFFLLFLTLASFRGARAPKKDVFFFAKLSFS